MADLDCLDENLGFEVCYAQERQPWTQPCVFLAGPTYRKTKMAGCELVSWRKEALTLLRDMQFRGLVFYPELRDGRDFDEIAMADDQVEWEWMALERATVILFWVPRDMATLPGLTTNIEFGLFVGSPDSPKCVYGRPENAPNTRYMDKLARRRRLTVHSTLERTVEDAMMKLISAEKFI